MTTPSRLNELNDAEDPAQRLLERVGWTYVPWATRDIGCAKTAGPSN